MRKASAAFGFILVAGIWFGPAWTRPGHPLSDQLELAARRYPAGSLESRTSMLAAAQRMIHPMWRDLNPQEALARIGRVAARLARRVSTGGAASTPPPANFRGNLNGISVPSADAFAIQRQADCSLTLFTFTYSLRMPPTISIPSPTANYERALHTAAQLTTAADSFPKGCADATLGVGSRPIVYLGKTTQNLHMFAAGGSTSRGNYLFYGTEDPTTHAVHSYNVDATDSNISAVAAGDLNGDGLADVIGVDGYGSPATITVHIANVDGTLGAGTTYTLPGSGAEAAVVDDVNGDGKADVIVATRNSSQEQISILTGNGDGTLNAAQSFPVKTPSGTISATVAGPIAIANVITADLRGTGHKDIVASNGLVLLNDGKGNFTVAPALAFTPSEATSNYGPNLAAGDLNGDGKPDLVVNNGEETATYLGNGDGTFSVGAAYATIGNVGYVTVTDLDGDGNLDIYVGLANGGLFYGDQFGVSGAYALMGNGDGTFSGAPAAPAVFNGRNLADFNGDKKLDLIGLNGTAFTVFPGRSDGTFSTGATLNAPNFVYNGRAYSYQGVAFYTQTDLNGDGYPDLVWSPSEILETSTQRPFLLVALNKGDGTFGAPQPMVMPSAFAPPDFDTNFSASDVQAADFNRDGKNDLIVAFISTSYSTQANLQGFLILPGKGDGTFGAATSAIIYNSTTPGTFTGPALAAIADVNGDKIPDLIVGQMTRTAFSRQMLLLIGKGDGTFGASTLLPVAPNPILPTIYQPSPVVVADMNGDGIPDLVTLGQDINEEHAYLDISLGNGDGAFAQPVVIMLPGGGVAALSGLAVADFNGDGKMDVAVTSFITRASGIFLGNGDGTLAPFKDSYGDILPSEQFIVLTGGFTTVADLNGDGLPDILAGNVALLNLGQNIAASSSPAAAAIKLKASPVIARTLWR